MAKDQKPIENLSANVEQAAEKTIQQAQGMMDNYFGWLQKAMSTTPWGGTDLIEKWKNYTEHNIAAAEEYVQKLSGAKDFQDVIRIQTEFMQMQMRTCIEQTRDFGETYMKAAAGSIKVPSVS